jgi:hypothetical protein
MIMNHMGSQSLLLPLPLPHCLSASPLGRVEDIGVAESADEDHALELLERDGRGQQVVHVHVPDLRWGQGVR